MINKALNDEMQRIRGKAFRRRKRVIEPRSWREKDYLEGTGPVDAGVILLPTRGCTWGSKSGCTMCGYVYDSVGKTGKYDKLPMIFDEILAKMEGVKYLKIFNSGSFFDPIEISKETASELLSLTKGRGIDRVQLESRPEFVNEGGLAAAMDGLDSQLEVGLGVETTNDVIRRDCINKNASTANFERAIGICNDLGVLVKGYLLLKPPFLTEAEANRDALKSAKELEIMGASRISLNPINVQRGTLVEELWKRREYKPPWLWSVQEFLSEASNSIKVPVLSQPTAAGRIRGPHNCGNCDGEVTESIRNFSITQDRSLLNNSNCDCKNIWQSEVEIEQFAQGMIPR